MDAATTTHPDPESLTGFGLGRLDPAAMAAIEAHLRDCDSCCRLLEAVPGDAFVSLLGAAAAARLDPTAAWTSGPPTPADGAAPAPTPGMLLAGGEIRLVEPIDRGGMGEVWLAWHEAFHAEVAVKFTQNPATEARFRAEIEAQGRLGGHPQVVAARTAGRHEGRSYLVMEYAAGLDLRKAVKCRGPLPWREAARLIRQAALGLGHAHARGLIHRDIKPSNLIDVEAEGVVKILDWGLARRLDAAPTPGDDRLTVPGMLIGTPDYMAPEQARDPGTVGPPADLYGLGCTFFELLTGHPPFHDRATRQAKLAAHQAEPAPLPAGPDVPDGARAILRRLLAKRPEDRYASASELVAALDALLAPEPGEVGVKPRPRRRWALAAIPAALALLAGFAIPRHPAPRPLTGTIDVRIWDPDNPNRRGLALADPAALPLERDDRVGVLARLSRPAYLYVLWIDSEGVARPVYPWVPGTWARPAGAERPVDRLDLPRDADGSPMGWPMAGPAGMETLVLLARETPLPASVDLAALLPGLPRPTIQDPRSVVWLDDWEPVGVAGVPSRTSADPRDRGPAFFDPQRLEDPVLRARTLLRARLGAYFPLMRAVSFANQGR